MTAERPDPRAPRELLEDLIEQVPYRPFGVAFDAADVNRILATPAGARLLALAETGAALERLDGPEGWDIGRASAGSFDAENGRTYGARTGVNRHRFGPTLPAAVAAVLEARDDG